MMFSTGGLLDPSVKMLEAEFKRGMVVGWGNGFTFGILAGVFGTLIVVAVLWRAFR